IKISSPSRKTSARKPSHLGSKIQLSPAGSAAIRLASIGRTGGFTGRFTSSCYPVYFCRTGIQPEFRARFVETINSAGGRENAQLILGDGLLGFCDALVRRTGKQISVQSESHNSRGTSSCRQKPAPAK